MRVVLSAIVAGLCLNIVPVVAHAAPTTTEPVERPLSSDELLFADRADLTAVAPLRLNSWSRLERAQGIRVYFVSGTPACYGVHATTTENADAVTVELRSGELPEAAGKMCSAKAVLGALDIPLDAPLGDRAVLSS
jgi:hypothetical protein